MLELVADVQVSCMVSVLCSFLIVLAEAWLRVCAAIQHLRERASTARLCPGTNDVGTFVVGAATMSDVHELTGLFMKDYMECHRRMHANVRGTAAEWLTALGEIDFEAVLQEVSGGSGSSVRLLKCSKLGQDGVGTGAAAGYVLYELRTKGPPGRRRHYCELVNIVVSGDHQGCGAGRRLMEALHQDLAATATRQADDLRLYVAEKNAGPLAWYRRLGFQHVGWQSEVVGNVEVRFLRMAKRQA